MLFNSYIFLLLFLPLCLVGYYTLNRFGWHRAGLLFLLGMSLWFYGYFNPYYLFLICGSVLLNYLIYRGIRKRSGKDRTSRGILVLGICLNLGMLGYFKYTDFFIENMNLVFQTDFALLHLLLPLGISFYTFQQISFLADEYAAIGTEEKVSYSLLEYAAYVTFFPQLVAGPIVTHDVLIPQLKDPSRKKADWNRMSKGILLFTLGLSKKVLLADVFGNAVNAAYQDVSAMNSATAFVAMLSYTLQIYFDFSGYSDMAMGLGWMLNVDLPVNFDSPYKARTITEFWKRWHITLTDFFRKYVYLPLGGSRKGSGRTYLNIFLVFFLSGFWHGAGWTFILWGVMHALAQILERLLKKPWKKIPSALQWLMAFGFVNLAWILFRADTVRDGITVIRSMFSFCPGPVSDQVLSGFMRPEWEIFNLVPGIRLIAPVMLMVIYLALGMVIVLALPNAKRISERCAKGRFSSIAAAVLLVWCIFSFSGVSTFLYWNF